MTDATTNNRKDTDTLLDEIVDEAGALGNPSISNREKSQSAQAIARSRAQIITYVASLQFQVSELRDALQKVLDVPEALKSLTNWGANELITARRVIAKDTDR